MLENKTALIYGGGGAIGGAVARALAEAGADVHLAGRTRSRLEAVAGDIGDAAHVAVVDAFDERAVAEHADAVAADAGGIDIALNADTAVFLASDRAAAITGAVVDLSSGSAVRAQHFGHALIGVLD
jgi:NADP-dependent 3-hydroxy acid dehydrogenase YdfG